MDIEDALDALPVLYAAALRLEADGEGIDAIATALDLDPAMVPPLLEIGRRKLGSLLADG